MAHTHTPPKPTSIPVKLVPVVVEDRSAIESAVVIGVFEDQDPIFATRPSQPDRVRIVLDDPEPSLRVDGHRDRLDDVRLGGKQADGETFGQHDPLDRFSCVERNGGRGVRVCGRGAPAPDWTGPAQTPGSDSIHTGRHKNFAATS